MGNQQCWCSRAPAEAAEGERVEELLPRKARIFGAPDMAPEIAMIKAELGIEQDEEAQVRRGPGNLEVSSQRQRLALVS